MSQTMQFALEDADHGRAVVRGQVLPCIGKLIDAGKRVGVSVFELEDDRTIKQLRFYWGPCLKDISEQARIDGQKYSKDAWHEFFKREFIPRVVKKSKVAGRSRQVVSVTIGSTKGLSVRQMSKYLDKLQAFAATELGVSFTVLNWESYR